MKHINHQEFLEKFKQLFNSCNDFFKLEVLPEYDDFNEDFGIKDWHEVDAHKLNELIVISQQEAYEGKEKFIERKANGFKHLRVRYVPFPLTKYLLVELSSYITSQAIGKEVRMLDESSVSKLTPTLQPLFSDILLFDDRALLKVDNPGGITKCSAFYTEDKAEIAPYLELKKEVTHLSHSLDDYMRLLNIGFINVTPS